MSEQSQTTDFARLGEVLCTEDRPPCENVVEEALRLAENHDLKDRRIFVERGENGAVQSLQVKRPTTLFPRLCRLQLPDRILPLVRAVWGEDYRVAPAEELIIRRAQIGRGTRWHQDEAFMDPRYRFRRVTVWATLYACSVDNGCIWVVPRSHLGDVAPHIMGADPGLRDLGCETQGLPLELRAGEATAHHCRTIHKTGANTTDHDRVTFIFRYEAPPMLDPTPSIRPWLPRHTDEG